MTSSTIVTITHKPGSHCDNVVWNTTNNPYAKVGAYRKGPTQCVVGARLETNITDDKGTYTFPVEPCAVNLSKGDKLIDTSLIGFSIGYLQLASPFKFILSSHDDKEYQPEPKDKISGGNDITYELETRVSAACLNNPPVAVTDGGESRIKYNVQAYHDIIVRGYGTYKGKSSAENPCAILLKLSGESCAALIRTSNGVYTMRFFHTFPIWGPLPPRNDRWNGGWKIPWGIEKHRVSPQWIHEMLEDIIKKNKARQK